MTTRLPLDAPLRFTTSSYYFHILVRRTSSLKCVSVHSEGNASAFNELAEQLGGKCSKTLTSKDGEERLFVFEKKSIANKFFKAVFTFPEVISVGLETFP
ncbi:hypothetical protein PseudUWO311_20200 [Pseudanabaena sp. UWO311]|uniref:hypothetical protein n=1 Tax=Pseudanabaena sp. UWO311 TaxID=2487337 RepID=UPI00115BD351|nr:hypothetical protein [Pseudanabaena sp. UWO311]TYQ24106.1 hypothetical protein PseudUWO311_20200 [Pseudanabaena sp. UWO311]